MNTAATLKRPAYDFAASEFEVTFPVKWANKDGRLVVTHKLRQPTLGEMIEYKKKQVYERQYNSQGELINELGDVATADQWLWDQLAVAFSGYPGMPEGLNEVTDDNRSQMRSTHKEGAINHILTATATILQDQSSTSFAGGEWVVQLDFGTNPENPTHSVLFKLKEWNERERRDFERAGATIRGRSEGRTTINRSSVNLKAFSDLFDELLIGVENGTINGSDFATAGREAFCRAINGEFKVQVISALTRTWKANLSD